jgi:ankyrin repeat protein
MVKLLLSKKANPDERNKSGETPLHLAAKCLADTVIQVPILPKVTNICNLGILHFCYF